MPVYLSMEQVCAMLHLTRGRINQLRFGTKTVKADPTFPAPRKLSAGRGGRVIWPLEVIEAWIESKAN